MKQTTIEGLGLGGSRLGSLLTATGDAPEALLEAALASGVRLFDTADIYGQGQSERLLGRIVARHPQAVVMTKVGKRFPLSMRLLAPARGLAKAMISRSRSASSAVAQARSRPLPTCFDPPYLRKAAERSLGRLG